VVSDGAERRLAAIPSADVVGYSRLMAEDEDATIRTLTAYREQIEGLVGGHDGRVVDFTGDNFLAEFPSAVFAVRCGIEIQAALARRNAGLAAERRLEFRVGVHLGDLHLGRRPDAGAKQPLRAARGPG
jgi:class 3 adenylate cyclase